MKILHEFISKNIFYKIGFWTAFLVGMALIFIPFISRQNFTKNRAYNSEAKKNLHNLFLGCKDYWADNGSDKECNVGIATQPEWGYTKSERVNIEGHGTETTFIATAQHGNSENSYIMDANGNITEKK